MSNGAAREIMFTNVRTVRFGPDILGLAARDLADAGCRHVFIVTTPPTRPLCRGLTEALAELDCEVEIWDNIAGEPRIGELEEAIGLARAGGCDAVVGLGGGSAMDLAKLVAALADRRQRFAQVVGSDLLAGRALPLVCIPTTAGTGSEVTPIAIVDDGELKKGVISPHLVPDYAYLDPRLTVSMPPAVTAATGLDALTHCIEAYANRFAHPYVDRWALEGMGLIAANVERAWADGTDLVARAAMLRGSHLGGLCLGPVNTAAVHALAYPLGGEFHIAHGVANSLLLPHVLRFNLEAAPRRYAEVAGALGIVRTGDDLADALAGIEEIERISHAVGIERHLAHFGISSNAIPGMAAAAMSVQRLLIRNPREVREEDARRIYEAAL